MICRHIGGTFGGIGKYHHSTYRQTECLMPLSDTFLKNSAKHSGVSAGDKHTDGGGIYLLVTKAGRYWRMNYRFAGKRKTLALGIYPAVSLAKAR